MLGKEGVPKYQTKVQACSICPVGCQPFSEIKEGKYAGTKGLGWWINGCLWNAKMDITDPDGGLYYYLRANQLGLDGDNSSVVMAWAFHNKSCENYLQCSRY